MSSTYAQILKQAETRARRLGMEASAAKLLMLHFAGKSATELYRDFDLEMPEANVQIFHQALDRYLVNQEPVQYIIGYVSFYGHQFVVNSDVLIPRFETEELVANVLIAYDEVFGDQPARLVDVGTGSGCLAIALKKEAPKLEVYATDISEGALQTAKQNAKNLEANITFLHGDMLAPLKGMKFDILVSNPPYIPTEETIDDIIKNNEPHVALFGGVDGLKFYRIILEGAKPLLKDRFVIAFEHGFDKALAIRNLATKNFPNAKVYTLQDMQGKDRMTFVEQR